MKTFWCGLTKAFPWFQESRYSQSESQRGFRDRRQAWVGNLSSSSSIWSLSGVGFETGTRIATDQTSMVGAAAIASRFHSYSQGLPATLEFVRIDSIWKVFYTSHFSLCSSAKSTLRNLQIQIRTQSEKRSLIYFK